MAKWRAKIKGLLNKNEEESLFPDPHFKDIVVVINENSVIRLRNQLINEAKKINPQCISFKIVDIVRTDKDTGKDYSTYKGDNDGLNNLVFYLSSDQFGFLERIKESIFSKLEDIDSPQNASEFVRYHTSPHMVSRVNSSHSYVMGSSEEIYDHDQALKLVESIENFYLKLLPIEVDILRISSPRISVEEYQLIKNYYEENYDDNNSFSYRGHAINRGRELSENQLKVINSILERNPNTGNRLLETLVDWINQNGDSSKIFKALDSLNITDVKKLNSIVGITELKHLLKVWEENSDNGDEEFWQNLFQDNSFLLSQIFAYPITIIKGKAYVGGKNIDNHQGNIVDFLVGNSISENVMLLEIKTPKTRLLGSKYRGVFNMSSELIGSMIQVSNYKDSIMKQFATLAHESEKLIRVYNPDLFIIIGNLELENLNSIQKKSLELFRSSLKDVRVVTYDELFAKAKNLLVFLEGDNEI